MNRLMAELPVSSSDALDNSKSIDKTVYAFITTYIVCSDVVLAPSAGQVEQSRKYYYTVYTKEGSKRA